MGNIIVSKCNGHSFVVKAEKIQENVKYWTGDEQTYTCLSIDGEHAEMKLLHDTVTSKTDGLRYWIEIIDTDVNLYRPESVIRIKDCLYCDVTEDIVFDDTFCDLAEELCSDVKQDNTTKVGETLVVDGVEYECILDEGEVCTKCAFLEGENCVSPDWVKCCADQRTDENNVMFIKK